MKKLMVIVLATSIGSYGYAQTSKTENATFTAPVIKKNKTKRPPPPPPVISVAAPIAPPPPPPPPPVIRKKKHDSKKETVKFTAPKIVEDVKQK